MARLSGWRIFVLRVITGKKGNPAETEKPLDLSLDPSQTAFEDLPSTQGKTAGGDQ